MPAISIIVPVYKVEPYLRRCVDSILGQSYADFELILVDDGSPDNCPAICDEYAARDSRVVVIHQENGGVSKARNAALDIARGQYIMFCDGDDFVSPQWCEAILNVITQCPLAWIVCNVFLAYPDGTFRLKKETEEEASFRNATFYELFKSSLDGSPCNKIYNRMVLGEYSIRFNEAYKIGEDTDFNMRYLSYCDDIIFVPQGLYYYWQNAASTINAYNPYSFDDYRHTFFDRLPYIDVEYMDEYMDNWLWRFVNMLENTHAKENPMSLLEQLKYNNKMMNTTEFRYCSERAPGTRESALFMKIVRLRNYYVYWLFQRLCSIKAKLMRTNQE